MGPLGFPRDTSYWIFSGMRSHILHVFGIIILEDFILALFFVNILRYRLRILVVIFVGIWVRQAQIAVAIVVLRDLFQIPSDIELLDIAK